MGFRITEPMNIMVDLYICVLVYASVSHIGLNSRFMLKLLWEAYNVKPLLCKLHILYLLVFISVPTGIDPGI